MADGTNPGVTLSVTGTVDGLNAALGELSDQGNSRFVGADTVAISVSNGTETSSEFVPIPITVSPVFTNVGTFWGGIENAPITIGYWEIWNNSNAGTGVLFRLESVTSGALMKGGVLVEPGALIGPDAVVVWTPAANDWGITEAFRITAWDGQNGSSNPAAVTVYLASIPTALPQSVSTTLDTPVQIALAATDPKGSAISFAIVDFPKNGTILGDLPNVEYIPNPGYIGSDSFTFAASDWAGQGDLAAVGIIVHPCDSKPGIAARTNYTLIWPTNSLQLSAYVSDDGIPAPGKLTAAWRKIDGPGSVELSCDSIVIPQSNPPMPSTNLFLSEASFAALGRYLLRLTLDDAWVTNSVDARVTIIPADPLGALIVNAGTDQTLNHPGVSTLTGTQPVGEHLKYLVCAQGRPTACMAWASALRHLGPPLGGRHLSGGPISTCWPIIRAFSSCLG